jgi:hypothetical protein
MSKTYIAGSVLAANSFPLKEIKRLRARNLGIKNLKFQTTFLHLDAATIIHNNTKTGPPVRYSINKTTKYQISTI